ncbi:MAG: hypothetical protein ACYCW6_13440 [Candidatus Xenobia bacterium]
MVVSPRSVAAFPAVNPLMLNHMLLNLEVSGLADAPMSAPYHLSIGDASGDVTYTLDPKKPGMQASGTFDGKPFSEQWTFGQQFKIDGRVGDADEHLTMDFNPSGDWHVQGTVGGVAVDETEQTKSGADADHLTTTGTLQEKVDVTHANANGDYGATEAGTPLTGQATFHTLKDRITIDASGQSGELPWQITGAAIFGPSENQGGAA